MYNSAALPFNSNIAAIEQQHLINTFAIQLFEELIIVNPK